MRSLKILGLFFIIPLAAEAHNVAVIGAGPAGVAAAQKLKEYGHKPTVFENTNRIGGKCFTVPCEKGRGVVEEGAIQVGIEYPTVTHYAKELGLKLRDYWPSRSLRYSENKATPEMKSLGDEYWPTHDGLEILSEIQIMDQALKRFKNIRLSHLTEIPENSEFSMPFEQWADNLGLKHFKEDFRIWMTAYGYGQLSEIPAYLPLYLVPASSGLVVLRKGDMNLRMLADGYSALIEGIVDHYDIPVKKGTPVSVFKRTPTQVGLSYFENGHEVDQNFDYLVIASGLECIKSVIPEELRTPEERELLNDLQYTPYDIVIADIPGLEKGGYVLTQNLAKPGHVAMMSKNSADGDDVIVYVPRGEIRKIGEPSIRPSEDALSQAIIQDMARFGFQDVRILRTQYWDNYFPHFKSPTSYRLLEDTQGTNKTVYVGSFARFEIVESSMKHAHDVVKDHILHLPKEAEPSITSAFFTWVQDMHRYYCADSKEVCHRKSLTEELSNIR